MPHFLLDQVADQHVEHGVHHTVQTGQSQRAREVGVHVLLKLAVRSFGGHVALASVEDDGAREQEDVIRSETEGEDSDDPEGQKADFPLTLSIQTGTLAHSGEHPPVAHRQHQQGQDEPDAHPEHIEDSNIFLHGVGFVTAVVAVLVVVGVLQIVIDQHKDVHHHHHHVNGDALNPRVARGAVGLEAKRVSDHQASIHGDTAEQEDADVHVGVVEESGHAARVHPEPPVMALSVIIHPEGHGEDEEYVRDQQAEQEDSQNVSFLHLLVDGPEGQRVENQTEDKSHDINRHEEDAGSTRFNSHARRV